MTLTDEAQEKLAERLWGAWSGCRAIAPVSDEYPEMTVAEAYRISEINFQRRVKEMGARLVGKKIGLTSEAVQSWLKVDQPDFGYLTSDMMLDDGAVIAASTLVSPRIEAEIAFVLKKELLGPGIGMTDVLSATECVVPALEVIDSRIKDWKIKIQDTVADNASSGFFVLGKKRLKPGGVDFPLLGMKMEKNGEIVSSGAGAACLGNPAIAVAWLANALGALGVALGQGEIILSGALGPVAEVRTGDRVRAAIRGLGEVNCEFK